MSFTNILSTVVATFCKSHVGSAKPNEAKATDKDYYEVSNVKPDPLPESRLPDPDAKPKRRWPCGC